MYLTSTEKDQMKNKKSNAVLVVHYAYIVVPNRNSYKYWQESVKQIYTQKQYMT